MNELYLLTPGNDRGGAFDSTSQSNQFRACSHEPGAMIAPGQALPRVHMMICCPGSTSLPRGKFIEI